MVFLRNWGTINLKYDMITIQGLMWSIRALATNKNASEVNIRDGNKSLSQNRVLMFNGNF